MRSLRLETAELVLLYQNTLGTRNKRCCKGVEKVSVFLGRRCEKISAIGGAIDKGCLCSRIG